MKFALIKELKKTGDARVLFSPEQLAGVIKKYPEHQFVVQSSITRAFSDKEYRDLNILVVENIDDADVLLGIKEVPLEALIPNKKYFFFSHTTKMQPHNRAYLEGLKKANITFYDYENFINKKGQRLISFGKNAGQIGAYQAIRTYGLKNNLFKIPSPSKLTSFANLLAEVRKIKIPPIKIVVTGTGNVGRGIHEFLNLIGVEQIKSDAFINENNLKPVFTQLSKKDYLIDKETKSYNEVAFVKRPETFDSTFYKYAKKADLLIAGHYHHTGMPLFFTKKEIRNKDFKINTIADISCDVHTPLPTCLRPSTPSNPNYGYHKFHESESDFLDIDSIAIMAVDNLPCELPRATSIDFGNQFIDELLEDLVNDLESEKMQKACVLKNGMFTKAYAYLEAFLETNES